MHERLKELRAALGLSQVEFSERILVGSSTLAMWELGSRKVKDIHISKICSEFNVSENWLRNGEGEMFKDFYEEGELEYLVAALDAKEDEFKINFIKFMLKQPDERWAMFEQMIEEYNDFNKKK